MLFLLRRLKNGLWMNGSFHKYLAYAVGELLLVVLGILIAMQINNWNEDRKERATLQSYLESIARNMREDMAELGPLRRHRLESMFIATRFASIRGRRSWDVDEIYFVNQLWQLSAAESYFNANTSSFEALKASGALDRLQGSGIEQLLSRYYDTVDQIVLLEKSMYDMRRSIFFGLRQEFPRELESFAVYEPAILPPARFREVQPLFSQLINGTMMGALVESQFLNQVLMLHYDSLQALGQAYTHSVEAGSEETMATRIRTPFDDFSAGLGSPDIVTQGRPALETYYLDAATSRGAATGFRFDSIQMRGDELHIDYAGGNEWAAVIWSALTIGSRRPQMDFSRFTKLQLELKGDQGGEKVLVHVKDVDYPIDREPISVELTLDSDWQSYEIDLAEFKPNDLSRLNAVLGLLIYPAEHPMAFSVRNARYQ